MQASAQLPADEQIPHTAAMLPVASIFDRELRVKMVDYESGEEHEKVVKVPCKKPAQPRKPTVAELDRLAPLERALEAAIEARRLRFDAEALALKEALAAQRLCLDAEKLAEYLLGLRCDAEALTESVAQLCKMIGDMQGIRAHTVDLSRQALKTVYEEDNEDGDAAIFQLLEVPEDLRQLKEEVRELTMYCHNLEAVPTWLVELVHLEVLCLDGLLAYTTEGNASVEELPALGDLHALTALTLRGFDQIETLPASFERLTSLKTLHIEDCAALQELPCFGFFTALQELTLKYLPSLAQLASIGELATLITLNLTDLQLTLPLPCFGQLTALTALSITCMELEELPVAIGALTSMRELRLEGCPKIEELPAFIGTLTTLTKLELIYCALTDVPQSIESLTALRIIKLRIDPRIVQNGRAFKTLACSLPALRLLQHLDLGGLNDHDVQAIGRSLKAWPLPMLKKFGYSPINLKRCWQALALPPEAAGWDDTVILQYWRVQQQKVAAFASGLHARLGAASKVSSLNDVALVLIADEVLGGWSLLNPKP